MTELPPLPSWDGLHPLVVHFPIALLLVAPLFILLGLALSRGRPFLWAALLLMAIGTAGTFFAVSTGEAAGKLAERTPQINAVLEHHEHLAERTRAGFAALTVIFAVILLLPAVFRRKPGRLSGRHGEEGARRPDHHQEKSRPQKGPAAGKRHPEKDEERRDEQQRDREMHHQRMEPVPGGQRRKLGHVATSSTSRT